jgi:hypothetical protein
MSNATLAPALTLPDSLDPPSHPHPQCRPDECAAALLAEITRDHFPGLHPGWEPRRRPAFDVLHSAAAALADFADATMRGIHGPGCPGRDEEDAADLTCDRGGCPYCATCGAPVHIFRGRGWCHFRDSTSAPDGVEITGAGHAVSVAWHHPGIEAPGPAIPGAPGQASQRRGGLRGTRPGRQPWQRPRASA